MPINENVVPTAEAVEAVEPVEITFIDDDESLYRRASKGCVVTDDGVERISSTAFNDVFFRPSVDRASMRNSPEETKKDPSDGIIEIAAHEIRAIKGVVINGAEPNGGNYVVDVQHRPEPENKEKGMPANPAHSQVEAAPHPKADARFKKIKEALALIANRRGWLIRPQ